MRVLVCPQEFKGSLTAFEAADAIAAGIQRALPAADVRELPLADGGPGTAAIVAAAAGGELFEVVARGPLGAPVRGAYTLIEQRLPAPHPHPHARPRGGGDLALLAVVESATTSGLILVLPEQRDPLRASTYGVGEQIRAALARGAREVIVGVGGTATNDGGAGAAQALGVRLLDTDGNELPAGGLYLARLERIDVSGVDPLLREARVRVAVDVTNPLLGPQGATAVYGPQKGVTPEQAPVLEAALERWVAVLQRDLGADVASIEGGGAGGGLAAGLVALAGATIEGGAALVGESVGLRAAIEHADVVVTGEGRLDAQTAYGKTVAYVASLCAGLGRPCLAVAGSIEERPARIADAEAAAPPSIPIDEAMQRARELVEAAAERLARRSVAR